jgi:transposase
MKLKEQIKNIFIDSLERNQYNKTKVSKDLGISIRTVRLWAKKYNIHNGQYRNVTIKQRDRMANVDKW